MKQHVPYVGGLMGILGSRMTESSYPIATHKDLQHLRSFSHSLPASLSHKRHGDPGTQNAAFAPPARASAAVLAHSEIRVV